MASPSQDAVHFIRLSSLPRMFKTALERGLTGRDIRLRPSLRNQELERSGLRLDVVKLDNESGWLCFALYGGLGGRPG